MLAGSWHLVLLRILHTHHGSITYPLRHRRSPSCSSPTAMTSAGLMTVCRAQSPISTPCGAFLHTPNANARRTLSAGTCASVSSRFRCSPRHDTCAGLHSAWESQLSIVRRSRYRVIAGGLLDCRGRRRIDRRCPESGPERGTTLHPMAFTGRQGTVHPGVGVWAGVDRSAGNARTVGQILENGLLKHTTGCRLRVCEGGECSTSAGNDRCTREPGKALNA